MPRSLTGQKAVLRQRNAPTLLGSAARDEWPDLAPPELIRRPSNRILARRRELHLVNPPVETGKERRLWPLVLLLLALLLGAGLFSRVVFFAGPRTEYVSSLAEGDPLEIPQPLVHRRFRLFHTAKDGQSLAQIASAYGVAKDEITRLQQVLTAADAAPQKAPQPRKGSAVRLVFDSSGALRAMRGEDDGRQSFRISRLKEGGFKLIYSPSASADRHVPKERVIVGHIETSFAAAALKAGVPYDVIDDIVDILGSKVSFHRDLHKGDRFTLIFRDKPGKKVKGANSQAQILAAFIEAGDKEVSAIRYVGTDGKARYFDQHGKLLENGFLRYPAKFSRISSPFSQSRFHPVLKYHRPHNGVDFAAPVGTPVRSVADGKVIVAGRRGTSGIMVKIQHSDRYSTAYLHLSGIAAGVRKGGSVQQGQVIGYVGSTGLSSGPHLHYSFYDRGKYVDPLKIDLPTLSDLKPGLRIAGDYLKRVMFTLRHYQKIPLKSGSVFS